MKTLATVALLASSLCANASVFTYVNIKAEEKVITKYTVDVDTLDSCKVIVLELLNAYHKDNIRNSSFYGACIDKKDKSFLYEVGDVR